VKQGGTANEVEDAKSADLRERGQLLLPALERINRIILSALTLESMLSHVLDEMLEMLECDRAWLLFPCDPSAEFFAIPMERTRPEWPGGGVTGRVASSPFTRLVASTALGAPGACRIDGVNAPMLMDDGLLAQFAVKSMLVMAIRPRSGAPWCLGIHHCEKALVYDDDMAALFEAIGARLADGLTGLLAYQASLADRQRLEQAQRLAQMGSFEWTREGGLVCSRELRRLFELERDTPHLEQVFETVHSSDGERVRAVVDELIESGGAYDFRARILRASGDDWIAHAMGHAELDEDQSLKGVVGVVQDITDRVRAEDNRKRLEAQLRQSQKMQSLGQLTGGVAHDFNNLLTVIMGNVADIPDMLDDRDEVLVLLEEVSLAATRAAQLTQMLTAFSRKQPLKPQIIDINELVMRVETLLRRTLGETIDIEVIRGAGLWRCEIDPAQLENALLNLALNARDAMADGGKLTIETGNARIDREYAADHDMQAGQYVLLAVTDSGAGMPEDVLNRAFEPFFTTKGPGKGTGLGLSMVYGFVKQSGGHIKLYSEFGEGTTSKIYLPRTRLDADSTPKDQMPASEKRGHGEVVLVVEDEPTVRSLTTRMVVRLGYNVAVAEDAASALKLLETDGQIALLFTDIVLPGGMNGAELARKAKQLRPELPVLFTSGYTENAIIHHGRLDPGVELLEKPFTRHALAERLRECLTATPLSKPPTP
jgi:signal transduction histidine kinase/CheY-like chemotaxis protein